MTNHKSLKVLISGGGTGGHIFPALSIANALRRRDPNVEILFVGAENRMEMERVPAAGYKIIGLPVAGLDRKRLWRNVKVLYKFWKSSRLAKKIIKDFQPDIAVGVGGYASGPVLSVAQQKHIPTLIQEQNSYAGVTNKHLGKDARRICVAYEGMERFFPANSIILTGNPVRQVIAECQTPQDEAKRLLGFDPQRKLVAVVGGSLGARTVNHAVIGKYYADECLKAAQGKADVKAMAFVDRMDLVYRAADLMVARAGASTISELQLTGVPAVLVPSPNVAEDHQRKNAQALADRDAAVMVLDVDAETSLAEVVTSLLNDDARLKSLRTNVAKMGQRNSDERIVDEIYKITQ
jgi:UDP-N-acetylglucosamine--N-acetylmuramyl-(pentapeptide) pyrophosphoryl-undecaprenol N-acetylglucosamine transferase